MNKSILATTVFGRSATRRRTSCPRMKSTSPAHGCKEEWKGRKKIPMQKATCTVSLPFLILGLLGGALNAQSGRPEIVFEADFADPTLPAWQNSRRLQGRLSPTKGPDGIPALSMEVQQPGSTTLSARLPVERIAGKAVLLDVWRKAENVKTGDRAYYNAKSMLSWKAKGVAKPQYSGTQFSDFSGTFDWERHRYVVNMPEDLEWASISIGLQACTGKAAWAGLTVSVDPRFPDQSSLERFLVREEREAFANLDIDALMVRRLDGGIVQVLAGTRYVPRKYWNRAVRQAVLTAVSEPAVDSRRLDTDFGSQLAVAMLARAKQLETGLEGVTGHTLNDRVYEITSLRERVRQISTGAVGRGPIRFKADPTAQFPVSPLVFGNNINTQNLSAQYDTPRNRFQEEFLTRVRPMGITFLRYPGGCNADVFNWKDTIGPVGQRKDIINYHNGTSRGIARFGVDEYLRFCEQEGMTPIITTAFCKDHPRNVDPNDHPTGIRHPFVVSYLNTAPERVELAADWVEYCNGSADTPYGKLRAQNGHPEPYDVKYWEIGNESYGPDPAGSCSAEEYAKAFPAYVTTIKTRDPSIKIVMNGHSGVDWSDTVLRLAGSHADAFQFHIYHTPRFHNTNAHLEGRPHLFTDATRTPDRIPGLLQEIETLMQKHLGRTLPTIISEFGMGNARNREYMTSVTSPVLVADMWRTLIESPMIHGANKWCLFTGYWFSQIQGPTLQQPDAPYYNRPEHAMHIIYARCRGKTRLAVNNDQSDGVKAVVFQRQDSYGVVLISREAVAWQSVILNLPDHRREKATCLLMTAGHPLLGNENDHTLIRPYEFEFDYDPEQPFLVPSNSVVGLIVPR